ncbi:uncharacterized protein LOC114519153 [Dendronephthya gigantea]|uniref:uncharacterized protein LOC114519153 n=1 Tax=Dendronephthya gigantea TaxID=151771 RepID=UPI00106B630A|nr:uncharacterized protein LOC114519153 [Dendronephthya gigantea]
MMNNIDETLHDVNPCKLKTSKKYKAKISKKIIADVCAMLNSNGGKVTIRLSCDHEGNSPVCLSSSVSRMLEQFMISIIGQYLTYSRISIEKNKESLVILVKKAGYLVTTNYNLYLPTEKQVLLLDPRESLENVKKVMNRKDVPESVKPCSHQKTFYKDKNCDLDESKMCQFKQLKADESKCTTLADRMTGKSNKLSCYVSAYANHQGGHIYYGIRDNGYVEGEVISNDEDKQDIIKKVEKSINNMIWPEQYGQPKRGEHWDIFFESVLDENSKIIPSTFVIVIYIAPCLGGVFTEEPECYEMVKGNAEKMSFLSWKKRISKPVGIQFYAKNPHSASGITWSSVKARKAFTETHKVLMPLINNGDWEAILGKSSSLQGKSGLYSIKLSILSKRITACIRKGRLYRAGKLLQKYKEILSKRNEDSFIFEVIGLYLEAALKRARGDKTGGLRKILDDALSKTELIEPGVVTATVYVFVAGTVLNDPKNLDYSLADVLSARALEHLQHVSDSPEMVSNLRKKACFILAASHLGCSINGQRIEKNVDRSCLDKTRSIIMSVHETILEGNPLSKYHKIQFNLVQSIYHYRHSQVNPEKRTRLLTIAFNCAKKAECLAKENNFPEMVDWSRANKALFTEELVRTKLLFVKRGTQKGKDSL